MYNKVIKKRKLEHKSKKSSKKLHVKIITCNFAPTYIYKGVANGQHYISQHRCIPAP